MVQAGAGEINLADTTGMANPLSDQAHGPEGSKNNFPMWSFRFICTTRVVWGWPTCLAVMKRACGTFDVCTGGLGGCPFVKGAAGNVPTEDAVNMFESMGVSTGIDLMQVCEAVAYLETALGRRLPGRMQRVLHYQQNCDGG